MRNSIVILKGIKDIKIPRGHGIPGHVMITGKIVNCSNVTSSTSYSIKIDKALGFKTRYYKKINYIFFYPEILIIRSPTMTIIEMF
jgi:hypothetical protein